MSQPLHADPLALVVIEQVEPLLENLDLPDEALANLARLSETDEEDYRSGGAWAARVAFGPDVLWVAGDTRTWRIAAPPGTDESDAARAARRLHGLLGAMSEGWDLDR